MRGCSLAARAAGAGLVGVGAVFLTGAAGAGLAATGGMYGAGAGVGGGVCFGSAGFGAGGGGACHGLNHAMQVTKAINIDSRTHIHGLRQKGLGAAGSATKTDCA